MSLRESLSSIPSALTNFISESASNATSYLHDSLQSLPTTPTTTSTTSDPQSEHRALPIPAALVKEQWRLIFTSDANAQDLEAAIKHCRDLVMCTDECSDERRWLVRHLVDLRYSLKELQEAHATNALDNTLPLAVKSVVGHHFKHAGRLAAAKRYYCDYCTGIIWSVVQAAYICGDCNYLVHQKCVDSIVRVCAHVIVSDRHYPVADICPEVGLASQHYKCAECETLLNFKNSWIEPRLCDYNGLYYCPSCHWNDYSVIPARIVHNWDFNARKVSRASLQELQLFLDKPLIKLEESNPKLFVFLDKLCTLKKIRQNLVYMRKYLSECKSATDEKLIEIQIGHRRHLIQSIEFYSLNDLIQTENGALAEFLNNVFKNFEDHIRKCEMCLCKAYICEICSNNTVIFPFDDGCISCDKCNSIYHRVCMTRKNMICPKCLRLQKRRIELERAVSEIKTDDDESE